MQEPVRKSIPGENAAVSCLEWPGTGVPLHFAHVNGFNGQTYASVLAPLSREFHLFACDQRGHGFSTLPTAPGLAKGWTVFRDDLLALLEHIGSGPFVLAGHSMGATASLMAAALAPECVRALVLFEPVLIEPLARADANPGPDLAMRASMRRDRFPSLEAAFEAYRGRGIFRSWTDVMLRDYLRGGLLPADEDGVKLACTPAWESECFRETPLDVGSVAREIVCPITIVHGTVGSTSFQSEIAEIAGLRPDTRVIRVDGASHFLPMERPDVVAAELRLLGERL